MTGNDTWLIKLHMLDNMCYLLIADCYKREEDATLPPKVKFGKATVIEAAFSVVRDLGWEKMSARSIANRLGSSIGPIYTHLKSMPNLEEEVAKKAYDLLYDYCTTVRTGEAAIDRGLGYVLFAKKEKHLFKLFSNADFTDAINKYGELLRHKLDFDAKDDPSFKTLTFPQLVELRKSMAIFIHGLAVMVNTSFYIDDLSEEAIAALIRDTGSMLLIGYKAHLETVSKNQRAPKRE
jgi:AcrR family transcriptional regulator